MAKRKAYTGSSKPRGGNANLNRSVNMLAGLLEIAHLIPNPTGQTNSTAKLTRKDQSSQERLDSADKTFFNF